MPFPLRRGPSVRGLPWLYPSLAFYKSRAKVTRVRDSSFAFDCKSKGKQGQR